jgi:hypothetical protein
MALGLAPKPLYSKHPDDGMGVHACTACLFSHSPRMRHSLIARRPVEATRYPRRSSSQTLDRRLHLATLTA